MFHADHSMRNPNGRFVAHWKVKSNRTIVIFEDELALENKF